ncbi:MAG TPA: 3-hydroxyacyl-CoA dehydrogenase/enoyl-CoA hydratase family protein [Limnochordales bacterium]
MLRIRQVAVIGAGTMGSQLAALFSGLGLSVRLFDIVPSGASDRLQLPRQALARLRAMKPAPAYLPDDLQAIVPANLEDHLHHLAEADWVVEAVVERLDVKRAVWGGLAAHVRPDAVLSTNTSGLSIAAIAQALPPDRRRRFLGTHFFNPPRYLALLEVVPGPETDPALVRAMVEFGRNILGKGVVVCRDTPYFIANRLGLYGIMATFRAMEELGLDFAAVDAVTGPAMGRPRSATFRTLDLVGLDVLADSLRNLAAALPAEAEHFRVPGVVEQLVQRGWLGEKAGRGFYCREGDQILVLDPATFTYRPRAAVSFASLEAARSREQPGERLRVLLEADDPAGRLAWRVLRDGWRYAAERLEEVAGGRVDAVDQALRWGFGWELGAFEAWDAAGVPETVARMERDGVAVPAAVHELLASGRRGWYERRDGASWFFSPGRGPLPVEEDPRTLTFAARKQAGGLVRSWPGASLVDLGDGVLGVELHSPKDAIGADILVALQAAAEQAPRGWRAVVVGTDRPNFGVGANLVLLLTAAQEGDWEAIDRMVRDFQHTLQALKFLDVPAVAAVTGLTLGGAAEIALHAARIVASAETYMGLVEAGAGLVPAGGGCKEMLLRALALLPQEAEERRGARSMAPPADPMPWIARVFETIATARVSGSAHEARRLGFLGPCDPIVPSRLQLLWAARQEALHLAEAGWKPPRPARVAVAGEDGYAALQLAAYTMQQAGRATEHDVRIAQELARILTGGPVPAGTQVPESYLLDLEREAFGRLCRTPQTQARMLHLLQRGKPLRN